MLRGQKLFASVALASLSLSLIGCSADSKKDGTKALFKTKAEAENAAINLNCTGAHKMGDMWMPCKSHKIHGKKQKKDGGHSHHQH